MSFEFHDTAAEKLAGNPEANGAFGLWAMAGSWISTHGRTDVITDAGVESLDGQPEQIQALIDVGMWTRVDGGYHFELGPSTDWPLPIWRHGDTPSTGDGRITMLPEPDA